MSRYGPHDPQTAPAWVVVLGPQEWPNREGVPVRIPAPLVAQRARINTRASEEPDHG